MNRSSNSSRSRNDNSRHNQRRTGQFRVDPGQVGFIIGHKGANVIALAKSAGNGCRIEHDNTDKGLFKISAWDSAAVMRAKIGIAQQIKELETTTKKTKTTKTTKMTKTTKTTKTMDFSALQVDSDSEDEQTEQTQKADKGKKRTRSAQHLWKAVSGRGKAINAERKAYGRAKYAFLGQLEKTWEALPKSTRPKWEDYKWEKLGKWNNRREAESKKADLAALASKRKSKAASFNSLPADAFPAPVNAKPVSEVKGVWGAQTKPDWSVAVEKVEPKKPTELKPLGDEHEPWEPMTPKPTQPTIPSAPKKFASKTIVIKQTPMKDSWEDSDDEEDYQQYEEEGDWEEETSTKGRLLMPPPPNGYTGMAANDSWDTSEWA